MTRARATPLLVSSLLIGAAVAALGCSGAERRPDDLGWTRPQSPISATQVDVSHPLRPVLEAMSRNDCSAVVTESTRLRDRIAADVRSAMAAAEQAREDGGGDGATPVGVPSTPSTQGRSESMRAILNAYVYRQPPLLLVGDLGFVYPSWWTDELGYCLAETGRYDEAVELYTTALQSGMDLDVLWRLALVLAWDGRNRDAVEVLEAWPDESPRPAAYDSVLDRLRRDDQLLNSTDRHQLSLN